MDKKYYINVHFDRKLPALVFHFSDEELIDFVSKAMNKQCENAETALKLYRDELARLVIVFTQNEARNEIIKGGEWSALLEEYFHT